MTELSAAIDAAWDAEVAFLADLVRERSVLGDESGVQDRVQRELDALGLAVDRFEIDHDAIRDRPGYSPADWSYAGRGDVRATIPGTGGGRSLLLNAHVDVVPSTPDAHWTHDPWGAEISEGRLWGRGSCDMKAGAAAMVYAVRALRTVGIELQGDLTLETVIEEECTGNGALAAMHRGPLHDAAIIPEPFGHRALTAQVGVLWARIEVRGRGAHAERADAAENAIDKAMLVVAAVRELEAAANDADRHPAFADHPHPLNFNVGVVHGGDWASSVPETCTLEVRLSAYPGADLGAVQEAFADGVRRLTAADAWLAEHPPEVTFRRGFLADGLALGDDAEPLLGELAAAHTAVTGDELERFAFTGTTDARFYAVHAGRPATCYGPIGANLHAPDEWVDLASVRAVTEVLALAAMGWCGTA